ncbi:MAG TPA: hemerythrin domain-containing protein [Gammaproteobacteria bacterium]|nr:hemerythrin domain-containing protein [Gammaproteobacteria bacterium]
MAMSIEKLKREHRNMITVLDLADMEVAHLERDPAGDQALLRQSLDYLRHYFDQVHHPHEDLIFAYVDARRCQAHEAVMSHAAGHEAIYQLGDILDRWLDGTQSDDGPLPAGFSVVCRRYLQLQRDSLDTEENIVFPLAERCLTASDWQAIEADRRVKERPADGERVALRYGALYQFLTAAAE